MKVILPQINFIWGSASTMSVTYTAVLPERDETVDFLAGLLAAERLRRGTRADTGRCRSMTRRCWCSWGGDI
jgi:hypothetical protein